MIVRRGIMQGQGKKKVDIRKRTCWNCIAKLHYICRHGRSKMICCCGLPVNVAK